MNTGILFRLTKLMRGRAFASDIVRLVCALPVAFLSVQAVPFFSPLAYMDGFVKDLVIKRATPVQAQDPQIIIVAVDETTLDPFRLSDSAAGHTTYHYRDPIDRQSLGDLLTSIAGKHPAAIGADVRLDRPTEDEKDKSLSHTLRALSASLP